MIWIHCGDRDEVQSTLSLAARLSNDSSDMDVLITADADTIGALDVPPHIASVEPVPAETHAKIRAFWDRWTPHYLIWNGGTLRPAILRFAEKAGLRATFINARNAGLLAGSARWLPGAARTAVAPFEHVLTADGATATRLIRGGVSREKITATGPILEEPMPLPHDQYEFTVMAEALGTRPVWFAADVVASEIKDMAAAHLAASRKSHRLLLLITPRDIDSGPDIAQTLRDAGLKVGLRSAGDDPEPEHQAYVADYEDELGLWYRIAPLTFLGGSLGGGGTVSPFDPIVLGSAVVHGPLKAPHDARFERLTKVESCREIRSAGELGIAISVLTSPEQSARMAVAGWEEITQNADTLNQLIKTARDTVEVTT